MSVFVCVSDVCCCVFVFVCVCVNFMWCVCCHAHVPVLAHATFYLQKHSIQFITNPCELPLKGPHYSLAKERDPLLHHTGMSAEQLRTYMVARGGFVASVIQADIMHSSGSSSIGPLALLPVVSPVPATVSAAISKPENSQPEKGIHFLYGVYFIVM